MQQLVSLVTELERIMGGQTAAYRKDFEWMYTEQSHVSRRN